MDEATIALTVLSCSIFLILLGLLIWGIKSGQFKNIEAAKYQVLKNEDEQSEKTRDGSQTEEGD